MGFNILPKVDFQWSQLFLSTSHSYSSLSHMLVTTTSLFEKVPLISPSSSSSSLCMYFAGNSLTKCGCYITQVTIFLASYDSFIAIFPASYSLLYVILKIMPCFRNLLSIAVHKYCLKIEMTCFRSFLYELAGSADLGWAELCGSASGSESG